MDEKPGNGASKPQRKVKFMPKAPPRREKKLMIPKPEKFEDDEAEDAKAQELLRRFNEASNRPKVKHENKPFQLQTRVSSFSFGPGSASTRKSEGGDASASGDAKMKEYKEPWDYYKYHPVTLPVRRPYSGDPELLDEEEFREGSESLAYDEDSAKPAEELGLMEEDLERKLILFQLPEKMPLPKQSAKVESQETVKAEIRETPNSLKAVKDAGSSSVKACSLNELPAGFMGKMLVYKSGAVKLKLGDTLYNVSGGSDTVLAQDAVAINTDDKHCCVLGELNGRAVVMPDLESIIDSITDDL